MDNEGNGKPTAEKELVCIYSDFVLELHNENEILCDVISPEV